MQVNYHFPFGARKTHTTILSFIERLCGDINIESPDG